MQRFFCLFFLLGAALLPAFSQTRYTVSGYVREAGSRELLPGVNVYLAGSTTGTSTNPYDRCAALAGPRGGRKLLLGRCQRESRPGRQPRRGVG
jgi:hypothetical protein